MDTFLGSGWATTHPSRLPGRRRGTSRTGRRRDMKISGILARKGSTVITAPPATSVTEFIRILAEHRIGAVVVVSDGRMLGIVSERDVVRRLAETGAAALDEQISELMTSELVTCTPEDSL